MDSDSKIHYCLRNLEERGTLKRLAALTALKQALSEDKRVLQLLNTNSANKDRGGGTVWQDVFRSCHSLLLTLDDEAEEEEKRSKPASAKILEMRREALNCVGLVASKANRDTSAPHLKLGSVLNICLDVLRKERWFREQKQYGMMYLTILAKNILPLRPYWTELTAENWRDISDLSMELYSKVSVKEKNILSDMLVVIITVGCAQSPLAIHLKSRLDFFEGMFEGFDLGQQNSLQESLLKLCVSLMQALALECRMALCKLGEKILRPFLDIRRSKQVDKISVLLYDLLLLQVTLHHPGGGSGEAHDWGVWQGHLRGLHALVEAEVQVAYEACAAPTRGKARQPTELSPGFLALAVNVYKQTLGMHESSVHGSQSDNSIEDNVEGSAAKRRRMLAGLSVLIDRLKTAKTAEEVGIRLSVLDALLQSYPELLGEGDYLSLLQVLAHTQSSCKNNTVMLHLCRCCESLLRAERHASLAPHEASSVNVLWGKVWDMTLRSAGLNQCEEGSHALLRTLLGSPRASQLRPAPLLQLLTSGVVRLSPGSVRTLTLLAEKCHLPSVQGELQGGSPHPPTAALSQVGEEEEACSVWDLLLRWLLPPREPAEEIAMGDVPPEILAQALVRLALKTRVSTNQEVPCKPGYAKVISKIETTYSLGALETGIVNQAVKSHPNVPNCSSSTVQINNTAHDIMLKLLHAEYNFIIEKFESEGKGTNCTDKLVTVNLVINNISLFAHVLSYMMEWDILKEDDLQEFSIKTYLEGLQKILPVAMHRVLEVYHQPRLHLEVFNGLYKLFSSKLHDQISILLRSTTHADTVKQVLPIAKLVVTKSSVGSDSSDNGVGSSMLSDLPTDTSGSYFSKFEPPSLAKKDITSPFSEHGFSIEEKQQMLATKVMANFVFVPESTWASQSADESVALIGFALTLSAGPKFNKIDLQRIIYILKQASLTTSNQIVLIMQVLKNLTRLMMKDQEVVQNILSILYNMLEQIHMDVSENKDNRKTAVSMLVGFTKLINKGMFGSAVRVSIIRCLGRAAEVDPEQTWALKSDESSLSADILEYLKDPFNEARLAAAHCIKLLFCCATPNWDLGLQRKWHKFVFEQMCTITTTSFENISRNNPEDELLNLTSSALQSMGVVVLTSPQWRKKALFGIIQQAKLQNMNLDLLKEMLQIVCKELKVSSIKQFLGANLKFLITQWLKMYKLDEFPWILLDCSSEIDFLTTFQDTIIPVLMQYRNNKSLQYLCEKINMTIPDAVEQCYAQVISSIIPFMESELDKTALQISTSDFQTAKILHGELVSHLGEEKLNDLLCEHLDRIVVCLFQLLHDPTEWQVGVDPGVPFNFTEPDSPHYKLELVDHALQHIQTLTQEPQVPLLVYLARESSRHIQIILQQLAVATHEAPTQEDRLKTFLQYSAFTRILTSHLQGGSLEAVKAFVVRDVIHMLLNLIKRSKPEEEALAISICQALQDICLKCIDHCVEQLENLLPIITSTLIMVIKKHKNGQVTKQAINILEFLIIENRDDLKSVIEKLDPFPLDDKFTKIQTTYHEIKYDMRDYDLEAEILHFLNAGQTCQSNRAEGLLHIRTQLATRKPELKRLYNELHTLRGFSEDCASSILHQLICVLVKLTSDPDKAVALEAAQCLGELGPSDLSSLVLQPESSNLSCEESSPQVALCRRTVELLKDYLVDSDRSVSVAAAAALYSLLETKEGQQALSSIQDQEYLIPFVSKSIKLKSIPLKINENIFIEKLNDDEIWCPSVSCEHQNWITKLVCTILESISYSHKYLEQLTAVCKAKESFSVELLPLLVYFILKSDNEVCKELVVDKMNLIFKKHYEMRDRQPSSQRKSRLIYFNKTSVQCMLNVIQFIRGKEHALKVAVSCLTPNFLHLAQAAQFCSAYFTSLLYAELWGTERKFLPRKSSGILSIDEICDDSEDGKALHKILLQGYKKIGDPDAVYGCGMSRLLDTQSRIWYFEHCNRWDKVMLMHDIGMGGAPTSSRGMALALQQSGLHHLLNSYLEAQDTEDMRAMRYECCWRLGQWDLPTVAEVGRDQPAWNIGAQAAYDAHHYSALKSLYNSDITNLQDDLKNARNCIIQSLTHASLESSKNVYTALSQLQCIQELEDFSKAILPGSNPQIKLKNVLKKWKSQDEITDNQFQYSEPILSQRIALLGIAVDRQDSQDMLQGEIQDGALLAASVDSLLHLARLSREEGWFHTSEKALRKLGELQGLDQEAVLCWRLEESRCLWDQGDKDMGRHRLSSLITQLASSQINTNSATKLYADALGLYGNWLEDARSENAHTIIDKYLLEAINVLQERYDSNNAELIQAYRSLARFADIEYQRVNKYMKSPMFESKFQCMQQSQALAETMKKEQTQTKDKLRAINVNDKQSKLDLTEINNMTQERREFLELALEYYLRSLDSNVTDEEESTVFRVVSLWLDNHGELQDDAETFLKEKLRTIPSYKFLPVVPQLVPHISDGNDAFTTTLKALLVRLSLEHPHHTLPTLLALAELYKDWNFMDVESRPQQPKPESRVEEAQRFIKQLKTKHSLGPIIKQMQEALTALVKFAYYVHPRKVAPGSTADIPSNQPIVSLKDFSKMQVSTLSLAVNRSGQYHEVTGIHNYEKKFQMVGGITAPKKIVCVGTDGKKRIQLLKGLDDLHQDAVMQQVFTIMNKLLRRNKRTRERKLLVRTYKVVPLSQRSGLIEWCDNTEPIGGYLLKAHPKLHPGDYPPATCRAKMERVQRESHEKRLRVFLDVCSNLRPVFHHFFTENFLLPGVWFERRLAYTRSVATSSMIGYILGLGDRHVQNILVDKSTAEVIHIDFGIAFEQGLVLNVPETVPFRLTRDMEDGLGISGVEGVFRKCCEKTMEVLRENQETVLTILQVLLYDPLYVWTISPERNQNDRKGIKGARDAATTEVEVNKIAQRALLRLQQKLMGTEEGKSTSVEGQVNRLIQQARDPENLSRLFFGWQPYL